MGKTSEEKKKIANDRSRKWYKDHCEHSKANSRRWKADHPERARELGREWHRAHLDKVRKRKYGITPEEYERLLADQNGVCAICANNRDKTALVVDHDHATGKVCGLLCRQCNLGLGHFADNPEWLRKAANYREATK